MSSFKTTDKIIPGLVFVFSFVLFFITKIPTVYWWESGLNVSASYVFGVPNSPGMPVFVLLGRLFSLIPVLGEVALRVNLIIIISAALTVTFVYLIITHIIKNYMKDITIIDGKFIKYSSGIIGALSLALSYSFWKHSLYTQVHMFSALVTVIILYLLLKFIDTRNIENRKRYLLFISFLIGLDIGILRFSVLLIPVIFLVIYFYERELLKDIYMWSGSLLLFAGGFSIHFILLIRAYLNPPVNFTDPDTLGKFWYMLSGKQYSNLGFFARIFTRNAEFWNNQFKEIFLRYFGWQFIGKETGSAVFSLKGLFGIPLATGVIGIIYHISKDIKSFLILLVYVFMASVVFMFYRNFTYPLHRDMDHLFLTVYLIFSIWIGLGVFIVLKLFIKLTQKRGFLKDLVYSVFSIGFLFFIPGMMFMSNREENNRSSIYIAEDYGANVLNTCEKDAILFTNGDNDTVPLWYNQIVKGVRQDVTVVNLNLLNASWYVLQLKNGDPPLPLDFSDEQINEMSIIPWDKKKTTLNVPSGINVMVDSVTQTKEELDVPEKISFNVDPTIGNRFLRKQDYILLNILNTNEWERPVYFSITVQERNFIGLKPYLRADGFAYKLIPFKDMPVVPEILETNLVKKFRYRRLNEEVLRHCEASETMLPNYRFAWVKLLDYYSKNNLDLKVSLTLDTMTKILPQRILR